MIGLNIHPEPVRASYPSTIELHRTFPSAIRPVLVGLLAEFALAVLLLGFPEPEPGPLVVLRWLGWVLFALGLPATTFFAYRMASADPVLTLSVDGLTDRTSVTAVGLVPWEEILGLSFAPLAKGAIFGVDVRDPKAFVAGLRGPAKLAAKANLRTFGVPIWLDLNGLPPDVVGQIERYRRSAAAVTARAARSKETDLAVALEAAAETAWEQELLRAS